MGFSRKRNVGALERDEWLRVKEPLAKIKGILRKVEARSREALIEAIGEAISANSARDAWGFFEHCGYRTVVQPF